MKKSILIRKPPEDPLSYPGWVPSLNQIIGHPQRIISECEGGFSYIRVKKWNYIINNNWGVVVEECTIP